MDLVHPHLRSITESLASRVPWARPQCIARETLLKDPFMRAAYTMFIWEQQKQAELVQTPPCQVCGLNNITLAALPQPSEGVECWGFAPCAMNELGRRAMHHVCLLMLAS